jgi:hypothetical protein
MRPKVHAMDDAVAARLAKAEALADEIVKIADDRTGDMIAKTDPKGGEVMVPNRESITRAKLRIDTRMWLMARLAPHVYGNAAPKVAETDPPMSFEIYTTPEPDEGEGEGEGAS